MIHLSSFDYSSSEPAYHYWKVQGLDDE